MRELATIAIILDIQPIQGADSIELATVLGWNVVVKKSEFNIGDHVIYFSIDSILDSKPYSAFLNGKPLKTKKIRGVISQGLIGPLKWINEHTNDSANYEVGSDVTNLMNVKKYIESDEADVCTNIPFPSYVPKTDENRVQNMSRKINNLHGRNIIITQKYDGTSATYMFNANVFTCCSRNNQIVDDGAKSLAHFFEMKNKYDIENKLVGLGRNIAIQGEICGPKINGNRLKMNFNDFFVFNIYDIDSKKYMLWKEVLDITTQLNLKTVDVVYSGIMKDDWSAKYFLDLADSQKYCSGSACEGIVVKTDDENDVRISFKAISNLYLLKYNL